MSNWDWQRSVSKRVQQHGTSGAGVSMRYGNLIGRPSLSKCAGFCFYSRKVSGAEFSVRCCEWLYWAGSPDGW